MLPTCKQVTELLSENIDEPITGIKWFKLKIHLLMCRYCLRYGKQIKISADSVRLTEDNVEPSETFKQEMVQHYRDCHCQKKK